MCLYIQTKPHLRLESAKKAVEDSIRVAEKDMQVWKVFERIGGYCEHPEAYRSPFMHTRYELGKTYEVDKFEVSIERHRYLMLLTKHVPTVSEGIHSFTSKKTGNWLWTFDSAVIRCIIPKGTQYILGTKDDIVSLKLRIPSEEEEMRIGLENAFELSNDFKVKAYRFYR
jgi:hypothetical protein